MACVLIVDDDPERHERIAEVLAYKIAYTGYSILSAYNSAEALEKLEHEHPEVVFLDHDLGGPDTTIRVANKIVEMDEVLLVIIHTMNTVGADNLRRVLENKIPYQRICYPDLIDRADEGM